MIKDFKLLTPWPVDELYAIGDAMITAGHFPTREAFLGWYRMLKPVELREARTDKWAVEQIVERRKVPQRAAS